MTLVKGGDKVFVQVDLKQGEVVSVSRAGQWWFMERRLLALSTTLPLSSFVPVFKLLTPLTIQLVVEGSQLQVYEIPQLYTWATWPS